MPCSNYTEQDMKGNIIDIATDTFEHLASIISKDGYACTLLENAPVLGIAFKSLRWARDFEAIRLMKRIEKLIAGAKATNIDHMDFDSRFENEKQKKEFCSHLINVLNSISEEEKIDIIVKFFQAFLRRNIIDADTFRRFVHITETRFSRDLFWLSNFENKIFAHDSIELQGLIGTCLVEQAGIDGGSATGGGGYYYSRTDVGKLFCDIAFAALP